MDIVYKLITEYKFRIELDDKERQLLYEALNRWNNQARCAGEPEYIGFACKLAERLKNNPAEQARKAYESAGVSACNITRWEDD